MQSFPSSGLALAVFNRGGGEVVLVLALVIILFGSNKLPGVIGGLRTGLFLFFNASKEQARNAGRSLGGIYGKPAAQAITPDNQVAELYDLQAMRKQNKVPRSLLNELFRKLLRLFKEVLEHSIK